MYICKKETLRKVLLYINILFAVFLILAYLAYYISPATNYIPAFFGLTYYIWVGVNIIFIPLWIFVKLRYSLLPLGVLALGIPLHLKQFATHFSIGDSAPDGYFKFMSYNVQLFGLYNWKDNKAHRDEMFRFIRKEDPDIICFQEYFYEETNYFETTDTLRQLLDARNVHFGAASTLHGTHHWGVATFSRWPIVGKGQIKFPRSRGNICIYTDVRIKQDTLRIFNVHFESNHLHTENLERIAAGDSTAKLMAFDLLQALRKGYVKRAAQADTVAAAIAASPHPVIICGDFNDMPLSYTYNKISHNLTDAFLNAGSGFGFSYAGRIPFLRIDYIFHSKDIDSRLFKVVPKKLSDHYPVSAWLKIKENEKDSVQ